MGAHANLVLHSHVFVQLFNHVIHQSGSYDATLLTGFSPSARPSREGVGREVPQKKSVGGFQLWRSAPGGQEGVGQPFLVTGGSPPPLANGKAGGGPLPRIDNAGGDCRGSARGAPE